jgi:hypothetical protein
LTILGDYLTTQSDGWFREDGLVSNYTELMTGGMWEEGSDLSFQPFIFLPFITGNFLQYIVYPYYIDIYTFDGDIYILEDTVTVYNTNFISDERWHQCPATHQDRYIGVRVNSTLMISQYETAPENRIRVHVFLPFYDVEVSGNSINTTVIEGRLPFSGSQGSKSEVVKVIEFLETRDFETDNCEFNASLGSKSDMVKVIEYFETRDFETDNCEFKGSLGSRCELIIS